MSKIQIKAKLRNETEQTNHQITTVGLYRNQSIMYQDGNIQTVLKIEKDKIEMKRIQNEDVLVCIFIDSISTLGLYDIKSANVKFDISIETKKLTIQEGHIEIEYNMILQNELPKTFIYQLDYEVIL